ncbi:MAG TPA: alpha/beta fold hydrolase [Solirubrobacteraceae bacterium]|jgi:pimeloyl-ACP methyl ester carboxylesterase|nr:alpha/beta fold hydrolase [Solirubrobacteraceae bacterium]
MRRRITIAVAAALALALGAGPAQAQVAWQDCTDAGFQAFQCGRIAVPIDRSGGLPGTIELFARRLPATSGATSTALVFLSGGPGQAATGSAGGVAVALATGLRDRDLLVFDQRGTGGSGALRCDAVRRARTAREASAGCAAEIGPRRAFYRTADSVADIEDLRAAAGYDRLALYGVSYGTKVALAYAAAHPDRVERLVLDSTVPPEGPDWLRRPSFAATGRVLRELCAAGRCRGVTPDPVGDVRALLRRSTIRGRYVTPRGRVRRGAFAAADLFELLQIGDLNPAWRALLPGAMRAAARGDEAPLLRLASTMFGEGASQAPGTGVNRALYLATVCEEVAFPWDRAAGPNQRLRQATAALLATPDRDFHPFDRDAAARASLVPVCYGWPNASPPPEPPGELPRVPSLLLAGSADVRTPVGDAMSVGGRLGATPVVVPHAGHSVLGGDFSGCARAAVAAFFRDGSTPPCRLGIQPPVRPVLRPPRALREVPPARAYGGRVGRTLNAVGGTATDALVAALGAQLDGLRRVAGVRRGTILLSRAGVTLRGVELIPGVRVTGTFPNRGRARLRIGGRAAARGRLTFAPNGTATGVLGGRRVRARPRAAAAVGAAGARPLDARRVVPFPALRGG